MQNLFHNITGEQTLHLDAPQGRPSSVVSVKVFPLEAGDDGTAEVATTGSGTVETNPNTTFDAASGSIQRDSTLLLIAATTGLVVDRTYLATGSNGETERVEIQEINSGVGAYSRHPLTNDYVSGDTFVSTRITISVDDTWIADTSKISDDNDPNSGYRVRWEYVVDSVTYVHDTYFNVVRYRAEHDVTAVKMDNDRPGWINSLPTEYRGDRGRALIDNAYRKVVLDLHRRKIPAEMLRNRDVVNELTILRVHLQDSKRGAVKTGNTVAYDIDQQEYYGALDGLIPNTSTADDSSGSGGPAHHVNILSR